MALDIGKKMTEVLPLLKKGLLGTDVDFPNLRPECQDEWGPNYAIVGGLHYFFAQYDDYTFFDHDKFRSDYEEKVCSFFPECTVKCYWQSQEIEVYRK